MLLPLTKKSTKAVVSLSCDRSQDVSSIADQLSWSQYTKIHTAGLQRYTYHTWKQEKKKRRKRGSVPRPRSEMRNERGGGAGLGPMPQCRCCKRPMESVILSQFKCHMYSGSIGDPVLLVAQIMLSTLWGQTTSRLLGRGRCSAEKMGEQSQQTQANGHYRYCIIKVESAATVPVMRPCTAGCREMQPRLQRGPALIDLYDPYPANRGLMGRDLWAKVPELGGGAHLECLVTVAVPWSPSDPFPPPPFNPSRLQEIPRSKGVWPSGLINR